MNQIREPMSQGFNNATATHQQVNEPMNPNDSRSQWSDESLNQYTNGSTLWRFCDSMRRCINESAAVNESINEWTNGSMNRWIWINEPMNFANLILHKCSPEWQLLNVLKYTSSSRYNSRYSLHILPTSSSKSAPKVTAFLTCWSAKWSSCCSPHFASLMLQKCSAAFSFWSFWSAKFALATVLCTFRRPLSQIKVRDLTRSWTLPLLTLFSQGKYSGWDAGGADIWCLDDDMMTMLPLEHRP